MRSAFSPCNDLTECLACQAVYSIILKDCPQCKQVRNQEYEVQQMSYCLRGSEKNTCNTASDVNKKADVIPK